MQYRLPRYSSTRKQRRRLGCRFLATQHNLEPHQYHLIAHRVFVGLAAPTQPCIYRLRKRERVVWQRRFWEHVIRAKLYIAAVRYNPDIKAQYEWLTKKGKTKMSALGAAMRKLVQPCSHVGYAARTLSMNTRAIL